MRIKKIAVYIVAVYPSDWRNDTTCGKCISSGYRYCNKLGIFG